MTGNLRDVSPRRDRSGRDPSGKRALFSASPDTSEQAPTATTPPGAPAVDAPEEPAAEQGTVVAVCSSCGEHTRLSYFDFALLHLPFSLFLPLPGRRYKHRMTCPSCTSWTWVEARWRE